VHVGNKVESQGVEIVSIDDRGGVGGGCLGGVVGLTVKTRGERKKKKKDSRFDL